MPRFGSPQSSGDLSQPLVVSPADKSPSFQTEDTEAENEPQELAVFSPSGQGCCSGKVQTAGLFLLSVVDWLHIIAAFFAMVRLGWVDHPDTGAKITCFLYVFKVVSHLALVAVRMHRNLLAHKTDTQAGGDVKGDAKTRAWYESQEWFVAMTFNSFMMIFVIFAVNNPYTMHRRSTKKDRRGKTRWKKAKINLLAVFARIGKGGKWDLATSYVMLTNIVCTSCALYLTVLNRDTVTHSTKTLDWAAFFLVLFHFIVAVLLSLLAKLLRTQQGHWGSALGALLIVAVDLVNVVVVLVLAFQLISIDCPDREEHNVITDQPQWSLALQKTCVSHCWWNMSSDDAEKFCGHDAMQVTTRPDYVSYEHTWICGASQGPEGDFDDVLQIQRAATAWVSFLMLGIMLQFFCGLITGYEQAVKGLRRTQLQNVLGRGERDNALQDSDYDQATDTVQQITFLTWMMTFALTFLERPYSANLFSRNKLVNPFRQPTSQLSNNWRLVLLATAVLACRCVSFTVFSYLALAFSNYERGWGTLTSNQSGCGKQNFGPLVLASLVLFGSQTLLSVIFSYGWTSSNDPRQFSCAAIVCNKWSALLCMVGICVLDLLVTILSCYFLVCINVRSSPLMQCDRDFGADLLFKMHQQTEIRTLAHLILLLYVLRCVVQIISMPVRRHKRQAPCSSTGIEEGYNARALLSNGLVHGFFVLVATFPLDAACWFMESWSPAAARPHWTNGSVGFLTLILKTFMVYLLLCTIAASPHGAVVSTTGILGAWLFIFQSAIQFIGFVYQHVAMPTDRTESDSICCCGTGRRAGYYANEQLIARHTQQLGQVVTDVAIQSGKQSFRGTGIRSSTEGQSVLQLHQRHERVDATAWRIAILFIAYVDWMHIAFNVANLNIINSQDSDQQIDFHKANPEITAIINVCLGIYAVRVAIQPLIVLGRVMRIVTCRGEWRSVDNHVRKIDPEAIRRLATERWGPQDDRTIQLGINIETRSSQAPNTGPMNYQQAVTQLRQILQGTQIPPDSAQRLLSDYSAGQYEEFIANFECTFQKEGVGSGSTDHTDLQPEPEPEDAQPNSVNTVDGSQLNLSDSAHSVGRPNDQQTIDLSAIWHRNSKWFIAMTFNTYLMLPALMFIEKPYKGSFSTVAAAFASLGSGGRKDYWAGVLVFVMVIKKTLNGYIIIKWIGHSGTTVGTENVICVTLLLVHLVLCLYIYLVPKLSIAWAHEGGSTKKGCFLLTVALVDWIAVPVNMISLYNALAGNELQDHTCPSDVRIAAIGCLCLFSLRVLLQIVFYIYYRYFKYHAAVERPHGGNIPVEDDNETWMRRQDYPELELHYAWRDTFQALTFNTWMMVPAALFVKQPYHRNLLSTREYSPFREKPCGVTLIYIVMLMKKTCAIYANAQFLQNNSCLPTEGSGHSHTWAVLSIIFTVVHGMIWFFMTLRLQSLGEAGNDSDTDDEDEGSAMAAGPEIAQDSATRRTNEWLETSISPHNSEPEPETSSGAK